MNKQLPQGVQDYLPEEAAFKRAVLDRLAATYEGCGYLPVEPPTLEYADTFLQGGALDDKRFFKLTDFDGSLLVLRPDPTLQLARIAATKLPPTGAARLHYAVSSFEFPSSGTSLRSREFAQSGVELFGASGAEADAELIMLAADALNAAGLTGFEIEIGSIAVFHGISEWLCLPPGTSEEFRRYVACKDMVGMQTLLQGCGADAAVIGRITALTGLFGGREVLKSARALCDFPAVTAAIARLDAVLALLEACGYGRYVTVDLGMAHGIGYYTGIVFRGISAEVGASLLDGGRYDNLCAAFGRAREAIGFSIGIKRLMVALERKGVRPASPKEAPVVFISDAASLPLAHKDAQALRAEGKRAVFADEAGADGVVRRYQNGREIRS
ncbi:MAG: ATP phosphoribosyltransferase regulatory subunit [Clostridiales bacterium]|jgi:ATP phosphoribosyltransferase regulatory subunit|nr:ATP phosphoribosyltransferase regulatory subunit [Clostridiales bacterium]